MKESGKQKLKAQWIFPRRWKSKFAKQIDERARWWQTHDACWMLSSTHHLIYCEEWNNGLKRDWSMYVDQGKQVFERNFRLGQQHQAGKQKQVMLCMIWNTYTAMMMIKSLLLLLSRTVCYLGQPRANITSLGGWMIWGRKALGKQLFSLWVLNQRRKLRLKRKKWEEGRTWLSQPQQGQDDKRQARGKIHTLFSLYGRTDRRFVSRAVDYDDPGRRGNYGPGSMHMFTLLATLVRKKTDRLKNFSMNLWVFGLWRKTFGIPSWKFIHRVRMRLDVDRVSLW